VTPTGNRATVVAWYGDKPGALAELIARLQQEAGPGFVPRPVPDVHATVVGIETASGSPPDLDGLLRYLVSEFGRDPLDVQFGGFAATDRRLLSRGQTLYERTVGVWGDKVVLIGWPVAPQPTWRLGAIRRRCEEFGFRHKYHRGPDDLDPDVYVVLGELVDAAGAAELVERLRGAALETPVRVRLDAEAIALAEYTDPRLPAATTVRRPIAALTRW
jgi:hypothetical protein